MNTALAQLILTADYEGTVDECIDFGEEPSVDYQEIHQAGPDYRPYGVERAKQMDQLVVEHDLKREQCLQEARQRYIKKQKEQRRRERIDARKWEQRWRRVQEDELRREIEHLRDMNAYYDMCIANHPLRRDVDVS